uniref:SET domain-containing protein n=1 Tax=Knipowitschia caucasica TaxID=637954 RepID=A0AAV2MGE9_KNICA
MPPPEPEPEMRRNACGRELHLQLETVEPHPCLKEVNGAENSNYEPTAVDGTGAENLDILPGAQEQMLKIAKRMAGSETVTTKEMTMFRRYCVALLLHDCGLSSAAVSQLTVQDWQNRADDGQGGVDLRTGGATYHVTASTEMMLNEYYMWARPRFLETGGKNTQTFLVGQDAIPLYNPLADVYRLKEEHFMAGACGRESPIDNIHQAGHDPNEPVALVQDSRKEVDVLQAAIPDMLCIEDKVKENKSLSNRETTDYRRYCQVLLMRRYHFSSKAISDLTVQSWLERVPDSDGAVVHLSTGGSTYGLSPSAEQMLEIYFRNVRPTFAQRETSGKDVCKAFFLANGGEALSNAAVDVRRFEERYTAREGTTTSPATQSIIRWNDFLCAFPITPDAQAPTKAACEKAGFSNFRPFYKKWRAEQLQMREKYILAQAQNRARTEPNTSTVQHKIDSEKWVTNVPTTGNVLKAWAPPQDTEVDIQLMVSRVMEQSWTGLAIVQFEEEKGKGVVTELPRRKNDVICDYHGLNMPSSQGKKLLQSGYVLFFKDSAGKSLCVDATQFPCSCHPTLDTYGRRLNHSRKKPNVAPKVHNLNLANLGKCAVILFHALRDIEAGEELLWDYGVDRKSFCGEGRDLTWLDN